MSNEFYRMILVALIVCFNSRIHLFDKELEYLGGYRTWLAEYFFSIILTVILFLLLLAWWPSFHFPIFCWKTFFHFYLPFCAFFGFFWTGTWANNTESEECCCGGIRFYEIGLSILFAGIYILIILVYSAYWIINGIINLLCKLF